MSVITRPMSVASGELIASGCLKAPVASSPVVVMGSLMSGTWRCGVEFGLSPLQEAHGQPEISVHPGADRHCSAGVIKPLASVPVECVGIGLVAVARQAGRNAVLSDA